MRGAKAPTIIRVKVFKEEEIIFEMRIGRQFGMTLEHGALAVCADEKKRGDPARQLVGHSFKGEHLTRARWAFNEEIVAIIMVKLADGFDEEKVNRHPDGASPVGIPAEDPVMRFGGPVIDIEGIRAGIEMKWRGLVHFGEGANSVIGKKALGIEHSAEQGFHSASAEQRKKLGIALSGDFPFGNEIGQFRAFTKNPSEMFRKFWEAVENPRMQDFDDEERNETNDRKNFDWLLTHLREAELIVIKGIDRVP